MSVAENFLDPDAAAQVHSVASVKVRAGTAHVRVPIARTRGTGSDSTTVTFRPRLRAPEATSEPMNPAPTTTVRARLSRAARTVTASSSVRKVTTPVMAAVPGSIRADDPVAMTAMS
jgi:hypothetical protein